MIRKWDQGEAESFAAALKSFSETDTILKGIKDSSHLNVLIAQIIESERRIRYVAHMKSRRLSETVANPKNGGFNPILAAIYHVNNDNRDEAFWLIFLATHFSRHINDKWKLTNEIYGKLGDTPFWTWKEIKENFDEFPEWLAVNQNELGMYRFGNHRKYESLNPASEKGLIPVLKSYLEWVGNDGHDKKINSLISGINDPDVIFETLYKSLDDVFRWGRLAKFDHLTMLAKVGLLNASPGRTFLKDATGPKKGAAFLLTGDTSTKIDVLDTERTLQRLGKQLGVGQQVVEDALCNWQKSPGLFVPFR